MFYALFRSTLPVAVVAGAAVAVFAAAAFFVLAPVTPFLIVLITVLLAVVAGAALLAVVVVRFLTTVDVLPSLDSLTPLTLRAVRVVAVRVAGAAGAAVAPLLVLVAVAVPLVPEPLEELAVDALVAFRCVVPVRVARAFSTMLLSILVALAVFVGETGRAIMDLAGDGGARSRGIARVLDDVGESTCPGLREGSVAVGPRALFLGLSMRSTMFSLSRPEIWSLNTGVSRCPYHGHSKFTNLSRLTVRVDADMAVAGRDPLPRVGGLSFSGTGGGRLEVAAFSIFCCWSLEYLINKSPIFALRRDMGIRLIRISMRVRRLWAWRL